MPDTDATGGDSLAALTGATGGGLMSGLASLKKQEIKADDKAYTSLTDTIDKGTAKVEKAQKDAGVEPGEMKPWNEAEESAKHQTDPIQAFGSLGSVFGILASAFTHQPFYTAMNASAAAINAVKAGNDKEYERASKAWEDNTKLAIERHKIQHEAYEDATTLLQTNMAAGEAKLRVLAARFGDQKTLFLLEHGLDKDVIELQAARQKLAEGISEGTDKRIMLHAQMSGLLGERPDPDNPGKTIKFDPKKPDSPDSVKAARLWQQDQAQLKREASPYGVRNGSAASSLTSARQQAQDVAGMVEDFKANYRAEHGKDPPAADVADFRAQQEKRLKVESTPITANRADEITGAIDRVDEVEGVMDKIETLLVKHNAITGFGGRVSRANETIGEIFGSNESDFKEFKRLVDTLQTIGPRVLLDSKGRPLGSETSKVGSIFAGNDFGDLKPNTLRAYKELRDILETQKKAYRGRLPGGQSAAPSAEQPNKGSNWFDAFPAVQ